METVKEGALETLQAKPVKRRGREPRKIFLTEIFSELIRTIFAALQ